MPFDDYQVGLDTVTFDSTTTNQRECLTLPIVVDGNTEEPETLTVQLTGAEAPLVINSARNMATITIIDIREFFTHIISYSLLQALVIDV